MAGGIVGLRYALGGMCVGGCGPGLIYGGQRLPVRRQVAQVEGDSLGSCGHVLIAVGVGPGRESGPASAVGPAGVGGLGIPEACGDGLGCVMVTGREVEVFLELGGGGEKGPGILFCFHGLGESPKLVILWHYHELYSWVLPARSPVRTTRPIRYSLLWYSLAVSTKLTPMVERASDLRTGGSQRLRGIAWLNPKSKSPSEKFAVRYTLAHHTGQNQELLRLASKWRCSQLDAPPTPKLWFPGPVKSAGLFLRVARYPHRPPKSC